MITLSPNFKLIRFRTLLTTNRCNSNTNVMIDAKVAVDKATDYLKIFFPESERTQLIEVELSDDKKSWYITMSANSSPCEHLFPVSCEQWVCK
ncbi:hypothetical protein ACFLTI_01080 [Bacteroidota bacterium]